MRIPIFILFLAAFAYAQTPPVEPGVSHELAKWRAARYSDVRYKLNLTLEKMSPVLKGTMEIRLTSMGRPVDPGKGRGLQYFHVPPIILDWRKIKGAEGYSTLANVTVNGEKVEKGTSGEFLNEGRQTPRYFEINEHLVFQYGIGNGENVIKLDFTSPILPSGSAITRYVDKEDGSEYIYSLFVPSDASTAFPVFDQPDLKAKFTLSVRYPRDWLAISNTRGPGHLTVIGGTAPTHADFTSYRVDFPETRPISTYVFAFAAGPFANFREDTKDFLVTTKNLPGDPAERKRFLESLNVPDGQSPSFVYIRKSQAAKFQPHAAEVFRLNREGIKFLEEYFDYKFPFPKYDLVLIPEFPFGGMEHAGATFLREDRVIFPQEPTKNDYITRANVIFHEAAHQWFGDTVTMKWFDDLWLKEGFAEFMAYKTLEKVMPEYNAWKVFYERNKQAAYLTDSTKGTTPIYQEISNLSAAKSAYGNIVYRKAPSFLKQAEFYIGREKFQTAVCAFLKKYEFGNAGWEDLVKEFENAAWFDPGVVYHPGDEDAWRSKESEARRRQYLKDWANSWVKQAGLSTVRVNVSEGRFGNGVSLTELDLKGNGLKWRQNTKLLISVGGRTKVVNRSIPPGWGEAQTLDPLPINNPTKSSVFIFPNYQDYGYGIFLLDDKSRGYVLKNIQNEKDDFLRSMMWGSLWDSVREGELDPKEYVELVLRVQSASFSSLERGEERDKSRTLNSGETDESTIATLLGRVSTAMTYYLPEVQRNALAPKIEAVLIDRMRNAPTLGQRITFYRAFLNVASTEKARSVLKDILNLKFQISDLKLKTKDRFDIVTRLLILNDPDAAKLLADLERTETSDEAKRYAYAAKAGIATAENKAKFWNDFTTNKEISESWIEAAFGPFNSVRHADLTLPYLERALKELPNHKRNRKIFFVNGWLGAFIGGQRSEEALAIVNKFLADNPNLDRDLRLKILENVDVIERAVRIRARFATQ
jgi:aminopeptidase N